jgi:ArsR family transcriptional regulator
MPHALEQEVNKLHAEICAGLADPKRILILYTLSERSRTVTELVDALEIGQPVASRHLKVLRERGMVRALRIGSSVEYSLTDQRLIEALNLLRAVLASNLQNKASLIDNFEIDIK